MVLIDPFFVLIVNFSALAFILLAAGAIVLRLFEQPIERIHLIEVSLASVFLALLIGHSNCVPSLKLAWLPSDAQLDTAVHTVAPDTFQAAPPGITQQIDESAPEAGGAQHGPSNQEKTVVATPLPDKSYVDVAPPPRIRLTPWRIAKSTVVVGFATISFLQAIYFLFGYFLTYRLVASAAPLELSDQHVIDDFRTDIGANRVRLAMSESISVPIASGLFLPTIVLPMHLLRGSVDPVRIRHSLDHEWKHIERKDLITWQLVSVCQILLWPQPFYWLLRRELRISQDQIADQFATRRKKEHVAYAATLVEFSKTRHAALLGALTMAGAKSHLYRRVDMLLNTNSSFRVAGFSRKRIVFGFASLMAAASFFLASLQLTHAGDKSAPAAESKIGKIKETVQGKDEATEAAEHTGFVVDALNKKPVANATVTVTRMRSDTWEEIAVTECQTDVNGKFTFTIPVDQLSQRYLYIMFDLRHATYAPRHCGSYSYAMIRKNLELGAEPWFKKLLMVPGKKISGRLVDHTGKPVADAAVRVTSVAPSIESYAGQSSTDTTTGDDGRFEAIVTAEGTASVSVIPIHHCMKHVDVGKKRGDLGDVTLTEGMSISGRVLDATGKPLDGIWVNFTETQTKNEASYEAKRSSKTDPEGVFRTRPIIPGQYEVTVETKATGALEKVKYANFHDTPPPAVFARQTIDVTEASSDKPFVIQAVPHIYITGQCYDPKGEITRCHLPSLMGQFNGQFVRIESMKGEQVGAFELMVPHGVESARLNFITNEHTGLTIQFSGKKPSPQRDYRFETIEEDISEIKVVRYVAPIVQVKVVDETGKLVTDARVTALYPEITQGTAAYFEKQDDGLFRSSSLVPNFEFEILAEKEDFEGERKRMMMKEGTNETITIELKPSQAE